MNDGIPNVTVILTGNESQKARDSFPAGTNIVSCRPTAQAVNAAVEACGTKWVLIFESDDRAVPFMLENLLSMAFAADVIYQGVRAVDPGTHGEVWNEPPPIFCGNRLLEEDCLPAASLILRESFLEVGGYRAEAEQLKAWDLFIRGYQAGWRFKPCQITCYDMRLVPRLSPPRELIDEIRVEQDLLATFYYQASHPCGYLRCALPAKALPGVAHPYLHGVLSLREGVDKPESEITIDDLGDVEFPHHRGSAAVLQFAGDRSWALMQEFLQIQGVKTFVEVDDNYLYDPGKKLRKKSNWGRKIGDSVHTYEGHRLIVKRADGVIVTTERLAQSYRKFNDNVHVIPNPVDPVDWEFLKRPDDGIFRIGWFASKSHKSDIPLVQSGLAWAANQPDVQVVTVGIEPKWSFPHVTVPWVNDLDMYRLLMGMLDVGVCPIKPDPFSVFRSDVKASEYNMAGAAVICSDVAPYSDRVHESDCLKASSSVEFTEHIKRLVGNRDEARQLAEAGREWTLANRHIDVLIPRWAEALEVSMVAA